MINRSKRYYSGNNGKHHQNGVAILVNKKLQLEKDEKLKGNHKYNDNQTTAIPKSPGTNNAW